MSQRVLPQSFVSNPRSASHSGKSANGSRAVTFCDDEDRELFSRNGLESFESFWRQPQIFVDAVNYRRGGWSGVSRLELKDRNNERLFFIKRQENQFRYSWRHPMGRLTFEEEAKALRLTHRLGLPAVPLICFGKSRETGATRGLLVTRAIARPSLADLIESRPDWRTLTTLLAHCGEQLYRFHAHRIRHGALYPNHIFLDLASRTVTLIDFEGSRVCRTTDAAIAADLPQLIRRLKGMPEEARELLLRPYFQHHEKLMQALMRDRKTR